MKSVRSLVAAIAAGSALSFGAMALAQDAKQPEAAKPQAPQAKEHQHRHEGMQHMRGRGMSGGCHGEEQSQRSQGHNHS